MRKILFLSFVLCLISPVVSGQMFLSEVQFDKIESEEVQQYICSQIENDVTTFSEIKASLVPDASIEGFRFHEREYIVKDSLKKVWIHYVYTNPSIAWNASRFRFGLLFSKDENQVIYPNDPVGRVDDGQVIYLNLNVLKIKNLATAFEITNVDETKKIIEFSYIEDNITHGKQQLSFSETRKGFTKITHRTYFKSKSVLRDHFLYPYFHTRLTNTYHRNMKRIFKSKLDI